MRRVLTNITPNTEFKVAPMQQQFPQQRPLEGNESICGTNKYNQILSQASKWFPSPSSESLQLAYGKIEQRKSSDNIWNKTSKNSQQSFYQAYSQERRGYGNSSKFEKGDRSNLSRDIQSNRSANLSENQYNFITNKKPSWVAQSTNIKSRATKRYKFDDSSFEHQNTARELQEFEDLRIVLNNSHINHSNNNLLERDDIKDKMENVREDSVDTPKFTEKPFTFQKDYVQQKKLLLLQDKIHKQRRRRVMQYQMEEDIEVHENPTTQSNLIKSIDNYFKYNTSAKMAKAKKVQLIPECKNSMKANYQYQPYGNMVQKSMPDIVNTKNKSTFIIKRKLQGTAISSTSLDRYENKSIITDQSQNLKNSIAMGSHRRLQSHYKGKKQSNNKMNFQDFIKKNSIDVFGEKKAIEQVITQNYKPLLQQNIPKIQNATGFSRKDIFNLYSHYLSIFRIQQSKRQQFKDGRLKDLKGVDFDIFKDNVPLIKYENKDVQEKILDGIKKEIRDSQITWEDFLKFMRQILAKSFSEKIDFFFYAFDMDQNRRFSWTEVQNICTSCLSQMFSSKDEFAESLSQYFTKYIFDTIGYAHDQEIPFEDIKQAIKLASGEQGELLAMLCGADSFAGQGDGAKN